MGWGNIKKKLAKAVNKVAGDSRTTNYLVGSLFGVGVGSQASRNVKHESEEKAAAVGAERKKQEDLAASAEKLNLMASESARSAQSKTDVSSMRGLLGDYGESSMGAFDVWKRRRGL